MSRRRRRSSSGTSSTSRQSWVEAPTRPKLSLGEALDPGHISVAVEKIIPSRGRVPKNSQDLPLWTVGPDKEVGAIRRPEDGPYSVSRHADPDVFGSQSLELL